MSFIHSQSEIDIKSIKPIMPNDLFNIIQDEINNIFKKICLDYKLDIDIVSKKYNMDVTKIGIKLGVKKRNRRVLPSHLQCMGRKLDGKQCTRGRKDNSDYCKSHINKLPYGRIDDEFKLKEPLKRGRKRKSSSKEVEYVYTHIDVIDGENYLVDNNNLVYSFDINNPVFLGIKTENGIKKIEIPQEQNNIASENSIDIFM